MHHHPPADIHNARRHPSALPPCFDPVDGPLLREQRELLQDLATDVRLDEQEQFLISGLVNFTDAIADFLHDEHGIDCLLS